ncbi:MAG: carotenoid biosynthesis protein [Anaerolineae bacterium]|nr:carotenoid biosynthesis protein [Anaerolineae bacterium]
MSALTARLRNLRLTHADRLPFGLLVGWLLAMISLPIARWMLGDEATPVALSVGVIFQVAVGMAFLAQRWSALRVALTAVIVVSVGWAVEWIGHQTGFPFGFYSYTERLQPQLGGVPLLIPLAWLMMLPPAWAVAFSITQPLAEKPFLRRAVFIAVSALAFTAWDLFLDPLLVSWGFWRWQEVGVYFGIPLSNYGGWLFSSALMTALTVPRTDLPRRPFLFLYAATWFFMTGGLTLFWDLAGAGIVGSAAMSCLLLAALWLGQERKT